MNVSGAGRCPAQWRSLIAICFALAVTLSCARRDPESDAAAVRQQIGRYTAAVDAADISLASQVWQTSSDVSFIWPLGHNHGWEEVKKVYEFFGTNFTDRKLVARDIAVHVVGDAAWVEFYWHFTAKQRSNGAPVQTDGRESQVYSRVDGNRWVLVHAHYSGMPVTP
jgi:ketosteroid isomerase-like protein